MRRKIAGGGSRRGLDRERMILRHLGLVHHIARRIALVAEPEVDFRDLVGIGLIGLLQAVDSFEPGYELAFSTYAIPRIRGAILDGLRSSDPVPRRARARQRQVRRKTEELTVRMSRAPRHDEVARALNIDPETLWRWKGDGTAASPVSLEGSGVAWRLAGDGPDEVEARIEREQRIRWLTRAMDELTAREREVLALYYTQELTLREIGAALGVTESRVSQIRTAALAKLRSRWESTSAN